MLRDLAISERSRIGANAESAQRDTPVEAPSRSTAMGRAENAAQAIHSANMEGVEVSQPVVLETYDYISGKISASTLIARVKALHGLE